jgi:hypothetical protein
MGAAVTAVMLCSSPVARSASIGDAALIVFQIESTLAPPDPWRSPPPGEIESMQAHVKAHLVRVRVAGEAFLARNVELDARGIRHAEWKSAGPPLAAGELLPWPSIERIDVQGSNLARGALIGTGVMAGLGAAALYGTAEPGQGAFVVLVAVPAAGALGGAIGAMSQHWSRVWERPAGISPSPYAETADTASTQRAAPTPKPESGAVSPDLAMGVGLLSTAVVGLGTMALFGGGEIEAGAVIGASVGALVGPAIGLASGGRGDLAARGLKWRGASLAVAGVAAGIAANLRDSGQFTPTATACVVISAAGALVAFVSWAHDIVITSSAVAQGRPSSLVAPVAEPRFSLTVRSDGRVTVTAKF